jgi:hypothetical protein
MWTTHTLYINTGISILYCTVPAPLFSAIATGVCQVWYCMYGMGLAWTTFFYTNRARVRSAIEPSLPCCRRSNIPHAIFYLKCMLPLGRTILLWALDRNLRFYHRPHGGLRDYCNFTKQTLLHLVSAGYWEKHTSVHTWHVLMAWLSSCGFLAPMMFGWLNGSGHGTRDIS